MKRIGSILQEIRYFVLATREMCNMKNTDSKHVCQ